MTGLTVFIDSIVKDEKGVVVSASGGSGGPPSIFWRLSTDQVPTCYIGKRYNVDIEEF